MPSKKKKPPKTQATDSPRGLNFIFRALRHRNYRLFFFGQSVSLIGTWISRLATSWLVFRLTGSAFLLGLVGFASQIPIFILAPFGGILTDRMNRRQLLLLTQIVMMLSTLALAYYALRGTITLTHILVLSVVQGIANAVDTPARQAFIVEMVEERSSLSGAIALNSTMFNGARLVGPSIAGFMIAMVGEGYCFLVDGLSFVAVIVALLLMRVPAPAKRSTKKHLYQEFREGFDAAFGFRPIRSILVFVSIISLIGGPYMVFLPIFAERVLGGGSKTLGFLTASSGLGALSAAAYLASRRSVVGLGRVISICSIIFGASLIGFGMSTSIWFSMPLLALAGFGLMVHAAGCNTIVQTIVDDHTRGRVLSFFAMAFMGAMPIGSLIGGELARRAGAPATVMLGGSISIFASLLFLRNLPKIRPLIREIYIARGVITPIPEEIATMPEIMVPSAGSAAPGA